jgi:hypothetical protein
LVEAAIGVNWISSTMGNSTLQCSLESNGKTVQIRAIPPEGGTMVLYSNDFETSDLTGVGTSGDSTFEINTDGLISGNALQMNTTNNDFLVINFGKMTIPESEPLRVTCSFRLLDQSYVSVNGMQIGLIDDTHAADIGNGFRNTLNGGTDGVFNPFTGLNGEGPIGGITETSDPQTLRSTVAGNNYTLSFTIDNNADGTNYYTAEISGPVGAGGAVTNLTFTGIGHNTRDTYDSFYFKQGGAGTTLKRSIIDNVTVELIIAGTGEPTNTYDAWTVDQGLTAGVNDGMMDDAENGGAGDGVNNLLEYALGGDPLADDAASILPESVVESPYMYYVYNRRTDAAERDLEYHVLSTTDLVLDPMTNATEELAPKDIGGGFEAVTNRIPIASEAQQFMGLEVQQN